MPPGSLKVALPTDTYLRGRVEVGRGSKRGLIVQLKEPLLREGTGNDSCEFLDLYDAFYVFSDPLPIVCTLIYRIDDRTPHLKLRHQSFSAGTYPLSSPSLKSG
jgi:hypothetical protein